MSLAGVALSVAGSQLTSMLDDPAEETSTNATWLGPVLTPALLPEELPPPPPPPQAVNPNSANRAIAAFSRLIQGLFTVRSLF
jgi:hypothetical protein